MKIRHNNLFILIGACLALFGVARAAPNIVHAFTEPAGSSSSIPAHLSVTGNQPLLPPAQIDYELELVEGLSPAFTARIAGIEEESSSITDIVEGTSEPEKVDAALIQDEPPALPTPSPSQAEIPVRLIVPSIYLDAPVVLSHADTINVRGVEYISWKSPDYFAVGWHDNSARLGEPGNTVINGHHNIYGEVFRNLIDVEIGDTIVVLGPTQMYIYVVANKIIVPEKYEQIDTRMENARWILETDDERLTLITCWPYDTNTHRLILAASPVK